MWECVLYKMIWGKIREKLLQIIFIGGLKSLISNKIRNCGVLII